MLNIVIYFFFSIIGQFWLCKNNSAVCQDVYLCMGSAGWLFEQAVEAMNGKELNGRILYVGRAQKRLERQGELKRKFEQMKMDRMQRYQVSKLIFLSLSL